MANTMPVLSEKSRSGTLRTTKPDVSIGHFDRYCNTELVDTWVCPIYWGQGFFIFLLKSVLHSPYAPHTGALWRCEETLEGGRWWKFFWIQRNIEQDQRGSVGVTKYIEFSFVSRNLTPFVTGRLGWEVVCVLALFSRHPVLDTVCGHLRV